jgi:hypothetical protein
VHGELLGKLRELADAAHTGTPTAELQRRFEPLAKQWLRHEGDENRLLLAAYEEDVGEAD